MLKSLSNLTTTRIKSFSIPNSSKQYRQPIIKIASHRFSSHSIYPLKPTFSNCLHTQLSTQLSPFILYRKFSNLVPIVNPPLIDPKDNEIIATIGNHTRELYRLCKFRNADKAFKFFESETLPLIKRLKDPVFKVFTFNAVLSSFPHKEFIAEIQKISEIMKELDISYNLITYNHLIKVYAKKDIDTALDLLKTMKENRVKPNQYTYTMLINALTKMGQVDRVSDLYNEMQEVIGNK